MGARVVITAEDTDPLRFAPIRTFGRIALVIGSPRSPDDWTPVTLPRLPLLIAVGMATLFLAVVAAQGATPVGDQFLVSNQEPNGNPMFRALASDIAHDSARDRSLVVWTGTTAVAGETEIYGRLVKDGAPMGAPIRLTTAGPEANPSYAAVQASVAYNPGADEYLLTWTADDATPAGIRRSIYAQRLTPEASAATPAVVLSSPRELAGAPSFPDVTAGGPGAGYLVVWSGRGAAGAEVEIYRRRVTAAGLPLGVEQSISDMGPAGDTDFRPAQPQVAYNSTADEYLAIWQSDDDSGGMVDDEFEVFGQRLDSAGDEILGDARLTRTGPDGDTTFFAGGASLVYNPTADEFVVAWSADPGTGALAADEFEVFAQRFTPAVGPIAAPSRVSNAGPDGNSSYSAEQPRISHSLKANEYLVAWVGDDDEGARVATEFEISAQRLSARLDEIGDDTRLSRSGPDGNNDFVAGSPEATYSPASDEYIVVWHAEDDLAPRDNGELEIYARRVAGEGAPAVPPAGTPPGGGTPGTNGPPSAPNCREVALVTGAGGSGELKLTPGQLRINQRIGQAAVRRANAIQAWLDAGLVNGDICGGSLAERQLDAGITAVSDLLGPVPTPARPRSLTIPAAVAKTQTTFELSASQLQINQRVYSAAVRRANALKARINGSLTGGDIADRQLEADRLRQDLRLGARTPAVQVTAASTTQTAVPTSSRATFTPTLKQLRINQKIAQAAVRRTNELRATLARGLTGENFVDGSITAADWAP